jgi:hypothetical protein
MQKKLTSRHKQPGQTVGQETSQLSFYYAFKVKRKQPDRRKASDKNETKGVNKNAMQRLYTSTGMYVHKRI